MYCSMPNQMFKALREYKFTGIISSCVLRILSATWKNGLSRILQLFRRSKKWISDLGHDDDDDDDGDSEDNGENWTDSVV